MDVAKRQTRRPPEVVPERTPAPPQSRGQAAPHEEDRDPDQRRKNKLLAPEKPGAGRMTPLGRQMETPASGKTPGPSGQRAKTQEQKKHTNK